MAGMKIMRSGLRFCVCALLVFATLAAAWEGGDTSVAVSMYRTGNEGWGRKLLQGMSTCSYDFSKVDYSSVTSVCKGPNYDVNACCAPFTNLACQYKPEINDFNSLCPIYFLSYLDVAGGYSSGVFVGDGRCNNGNALCSN